MEVTVALPSIGVSEFCKHRHVIGSGHTEFTLTSLVERDESRTNTPKNKLGKDQDGFDRNGLKTAPDWDYLVRLVEANFHLRRPGYRDGVVLVPVPVATPDGRPTFTCPIVELKEGDTLFGSFRARRPGETPRKALNVPYRWGTDALFCDIVLYSRETLEEGDEERTGADWDIITILGKLDNEDMPMPPETLMANHFGADGGTATNMSPEEFEAALRKSFEFWKGRATLAPADTSFKF